MSARKKRVTAGDKTICLPIAAGIDYNQLVNDTAGFTAGFRAYLDAQIAQRRELFLERIEEGYCLPGVKSGRLGITSRWIRLKCN